MKVLNKLAAVALAGVFAVGCGDDNGTGTNGGVTMQDLEGDWNALVFEYTDLAGNFPTLDIIQVGGAFSLTITATSATNGSYSGLLTTPPDPIPAPITGTLVISSDGAQITLNDAALGTIVFTSFVTSGNPITSVTFSTNDTPFDWGTGTDVPASLRVILQKQ